MHTTCQLCGGCVSSSQATGGSSKPAESTASSREKEGGGGLAAVLSHFGYVEWPDVGGTTYPLRATQGQVELLPVVDGSPEDVPGRTGQTLR